MYSNNILNFQESPTILNAYTKKSGNLLKAPRISYNSNTESLSMSQVNIQFSKSEFQLPYNIHFWTNNFGKFA